MSKHSPIEPEAIERLEGLFKTVRSAAFQARQIPTLNHVAKDHTRAIEYMLILVEHDLRKMYGDLMEPTYEDTERLREIIRSREAEGLGVHISRSFEEVTQYLREYYRLRRGVEA